MRRVLCNFSLLLLFFLEISEAKEPTWKKTKEASAGRDFAILRYLDKHKLSQEEALEAFWELKVPKKEHLAKIGRLGEDEGNNSLWGCFKTEAKMLSSVTPECADLGFTLTKACALNADEQRILSQTLLPFSQEKALYLTLLSESNVSLLMKQGLPIFFDFFLGITDTTRERFDLNLTDEMKAYLNNEPKKLERVIKTAFLEPKLTHLRNSLLLSSTLMPSHEGSFYLFLIALNSHSENAKQWLWRSLEKGKNERERHRALFWLWYVYGDDDAKKRLLESEYLSFYALYLHEEHDKIPLVPMEPAVYGISWEEIGADHWDKETINPLVERVKEKVKKEFENSSVFSYIHGPFRPFLAAVARQESSFDNKTFSHAYAIGALQLIPLVIDEIAAKRKEQGGNYEEFFKPEKNVAYASDFLSALAANWRHPLFTAYSYNGGSGYFKRQLSRGLFTVSSSRSLYEPFLSMESISYEETREYGKKVLTNYVLYSSLYRPECGVTLHRLLETSVWPLNTQIEHSETNSCQFGGK